METRPWKVCVVGGGVVGLGSAYLINELNVAGKSVDLTIISEQFAPDVTSSVAAGFWEPYSVGGPEQFPLIKKWATSTWDHIYRLNTSAEGAKAGTCMLFGYALLEKPDADHMADWRKTFFNYNEMTEKELAMFPTYSNGYSYTTLMANPERYLPWLTEKLRERKVKFIKRKVERLEELSDEYDVIVNCTGVGAAKLTNDQEIQPGRGQIIRVLAPWVKHHIIADKTTSTGETLYIIPCPDFVVLGGVNQKGNWNLSASQEDRKHIWEGCCRLIPSLRHAEVLEDRVGLRPMRGNIRLEKEQIDTRHGKKWVVHNYGHGGSGVTTHYGCGEEAAGLVKECLQGLARQAKL